ncbi:hypothetical protein SAMN05660284_02043 [Formivibrio citricus]|uniref:3-keto-alpha-glucoside-1,2-lyase/3-keto-2-hydroxy-glucal hydratase domain-containing protein n=1 Tax=Formivibrio citricus TaxID=83765 RepID=A0A1I5B450_9NEIS|nr:DUF1080 domain-containing protein [Formivibrio citricus]SFN69289.1 hypothetical protein SAMN05660284_02043 [Formivibrio citricus]
MKKLISAFIVTLLMAGTVSAETIKWEGREFYAKNVHASIVKLNGEEVLKVERNLKVFPFDINRLSETVDEPTYVKLKDFEFSDGIFEVKVLARVQQPTPFPASQGFIGIHYRVNADDSAFESIYLRPNVGRADNQASRNHAVQYFAYPGYKFDRLRKESNGLYETYADIGLDEWITMRIHVKGERAELYLNNAKYPSFIVNKMKGTSASGGIGLFVDIGTEGYFKDFKIISSMHPKLKGGA